MSIFRLRQAILNNNIETVKTLIKEEIDVNEMFEYDRKTMTPLHVATLCKNYKIMELLIKAKADVNKQDSVGKTALQYSICEYVQRFDLTKILIDAGANVNSKNSEGRTPLHLAVEERNLPLVKYLLSQGACPNMKHNGGMTPLHVAFMRTYQWYLGLSPKIIKCLLRNGANANSVDSNGQTPLAIMLISQNRGGTSAQAKKILKIMLKYHDFNTVDPTKNNVLNITPNGNIRKIILQHLAKLQALNLPIHQDILKTISGNCNYSKYFEECIEELDKAKNAKLRNCWVSYFNLLVDGTRKLKNYAGNADLKKDFIVGDCEKHFPIFGDSIRENGIKAMIKRELIDKSVTFLSKHLPVYNPTHLVIKDILDSLSKEDLSMFCEY